MTAEQFADALAHTESENNPQAWGDHDKHGVPMAMGRWQIHAARKADLIRRYNIWPAVNETHDSWQRRLIIAMYQEHSPYKTPVEIACYWHKGHFVDPADDAEYAARFRRYCPANG